jgi:hypothetical protein
LPADIGPCFAAFPRFHYDPVTAGCREFTYGGCGGNLNNFMTRADCEQKCAHRAKSCQLCTTTDGCAPHDCSGCPVNGDVTGQTCAELGLDCVYEQCGPICRCRESAAGLAWACVYLPC